MSQQHNYYNPAPQWAQYEQPNTHRGLAIAALVLGIAGIVFGLVPITFFLALAGGTLAIIFGALGRRHGMGKWGLALGIVAVALGIWGATIVNKAASDLQNYNDQYTQYTRCLDSATTASQIDACGVYLN